MGWWEESEKIDTVGFNKGGTVRIGDVCGDDGHAVHSSSFGSTEDGPLCRAPRRAT
jgi:hypothetical protein